MAQIDLGYPRARRWAVRLGAAWGWAFAGLVVVLAAVAFDDPGIERPLETGNGLSGVSAPQDWRGNSARLPELR